MRILRWLTTVGTAILAVVAVSGAPAFADPVAPAQGAADYAATKLGDPYVFGASGPNRFDNPGLVQAAYASVGVPLPHSTSGQYGLATPIGLADLRAGDLVFYGDPAGASPTSVAIYEGGGRVINAGHTGTVVAYHAYDTGQIYSFGRVA